MERQDLRALRNPKPNPNAQCDSFVHELLPHPRRTFLPYPHFHEIVRLRVIHEAFHPVPNPSRSPA